MRIEPSCDKASVVCRALLLKAVEAASNALECEGLGLEDAGFWREDAKAYRKACEAIEAQREKAGK